MKKILNIVLAAAILVSCTKERIAGPSHAEEDTGAVLMTFSARIDDGDDTKAYLGGSSADASRSVLWSADDSIAVSNGKALARFVTDGISGTDAVFKGMIGEAPAYYAFYPYSPDVTFSDSTFSFIIPSTQKYVRDGVNPNSLPMVARMKEGTFEFKNLCGILVVRLTGSGIVSSITLSGIDESGASVRLSGDARAAMNYSDVPRLTMASSASSSILLDCSGEEEGGVALSQTEPVTFHFVVPPAVFGTFRIKVRTAEGSMNKTSDPARPMTVKRAERTTLSSFEYERSTGYLNDDGSANCYIVSSYGVHKFDATAKGPSVEPVGAGASAEVIWETVGSDTAPDKGAVVSDVGYDAGDVYFRANADGNALIAVKNAAGEILWSWHIWVCEGFDPAATAHVYDGGAGIVMDRDLGAIYRAEGDIFIGLRYQWGRKDPLGGAYIKNSTECGAVFNGTQFELKESTAQTGTIDYTIKHPTHSLQANSINADWMYTSEPDTTRWDREKTMYDPCPPGWKVAEWNTFINAARGKDTGTLQWDDTVLGCNLGGFFGSSPSIWYYGTDWHYTSGAFNARENGRVTVFQAYIAGVYRSCLDHTTFESICGGSAGEYYLRCIDAVHTAPVLGATTSSGITGTTATLSSSIKSRGGYDVTETGFIWSSELWVINELAADDSRFHRTTCGQNGENFSLTLTNLEIKTHYYVRPYAVNALGTAYGDMMEFETTMEGDSGGDVGEGEEFIW